MYVELLRLYLSDVKLFCRCFPYSSVGKECACNAGGAGNAGWIPGSGKCPGGGKAMTSLDSILKSRDIILPAKVCLVKAMAFPVVTYGCESWTLRKAECQRIDAFELWCWRRLLRVPWTARRSNQSILKEISP